VNVVFANPLLLLGGLLSLAPLIIHLLYKNRVTVVKFSSLRFIELVQKENSRKFRLRELLLLIVRMLIILLLALAVAKPVLVKSGSPASFGASAAKNKKTVLVIDNSLSMGYYENAVTLLDEAVKKAGKLLDATFERGDRAVVLPAAAGADLFYGEVFTKELAKEKLAAVKPTYRRASIMEALALVDSDPEAGQVPRTVYVFSDFQAANFSNVSAPEGRRKYELVLVDLGRKDCFNLSVRSVATPHSFFSLDQEANFGVTVGNTGLLGGRGIVEVFLGPKKAGQKTADFAAREALSFEFPFLSGKPGVVMGRARLDGDNLRLDNDRYFLDSAVEKVRIVVVDDSDSSSFVRKVFEAYGYRSVFDVRTVRSAEIPGAVGSADLVILSSFGGLSDAGAESLRRFLVSGRSVVIGLENDTDIAAFNQYLYMKNVVPVRLLNKVLLPPQDRTNRAFGVRDVDWSHGLLSFFRDYNFFKLLKVWGYFKTEFNLSDPNLNVLAKYNDVSSALIEYVHRNEKEQEAGHVILFTSSLSDGLNDLPWHPNFPAFLLQTVRYSSVRKFPDLNAGDHRMTAYNLFNAGAAEALQRYDDGRRLWTVWKDEALDIPGIYRLGERYFTVNTWPPESDLTGLTPRQMKDVFGNFRLIGEEDNFEQKAAEIGNGRPLSAVLIFLSLIMLLAELFLANDLLKRRSA
jgi:hypothetical protein